MNIFKDFDFTVLDNPDFEESSVREEFVTPILKLLGYKSFGVNKIIREKGLQHPFLQTGSQKREITSYPDYLLEVKGEYVWVLDAKAPNEDIYSGKNREQAYFYAIHSEIRVDYYGLCNGREFVLYHISEDKPIINFHLSDFEDYFERLKEILSPDAFVQKEILKGFKVESKKKTTNYLDKKQPKTLPVRKRAAKRHFGVHGYFTKQSWNVVQEYITNFTKKGDIVLDSFGGSGVTAIEALMTGRKGIHIDINPMSTFIVDSLTCPINLKMLQKEFENIQNKFQNGKPILESEIKSAKKKYWYPKGIKLMKNADVENIEDLFNDLQLAQLSFLKNLINKIKNANIRKTLLLVFSTSLTKLNLTYHNSNAASKNAGNSAAFAYYRYRIAKKPVLLDIWDTFAGKYKNIVRAKKDIEAYINEKTIENLTIKKATATNLDFIEDESIDYIYTDPPYANKIPYLDLSVMWNSWLKLDVTNEDYEEEAIEGGERKKSAEVYFELLTESMKEMYRVLKYDRWMSFVFAHKDPKYWHFIVEKAEEIGFEYVGSVKQDNGQTSYKKRTMKWSVLAGQLIINFKKVKTPQAIQKANLGVEIFDLIIETIESTIAKNDGATLEQINDSLIISGLELGFLDILSKEYKDLSPLLNNNFDYHEDTDTFHIRKNKKFKTNIPVDLRIRYFLLSYLRRKHKNKEYPTTDEVILDIMPLLKNGITPENQTILKVLETIAQKIEGDKWRLIEDNKPELFN